MIEPSVSSQFVLHGSLRHTFEVCQATLWVDVIPRPKVVGITLGFDDKSILHNLRGLTLPYVSIQELAHCASIIQGSDGVLAPKASYDQLICTHKTTAGARARRSGVTWVNALTIGGVPLWTIVLQFFEVGIVELRACFYAINSGRRPFF